MRRRAPSCVSAAILAAAAAPPGAAELPEGFTSEIAAAGFSLPVGITFAPDGRMFVVQRDGAVLVVQDGELLSDLFIDLRDEVNAQSQRGMLGIALDPAFLVNRHVYLLYTVDPVAGEPDEPPVQPTFARLTRYTGTAASGGNVADPASRHVLIGGVPGEGFPTCHVSHTIGTVLFGYDGSLLVGAGDGAHANFVDSGTFDPPCFGPGMFGRDEDVGAFRAQYLGSLSGKILRVDPATGLGLADNPHWNGDGAAKRSRVWLSGLRNPYRFTLRPGTPGPGTLYLGDTGWNSYEEINVAYGGENMGWPCHEGTPLTPLYDEAVPAHSGCDTIETPQNPGPLTGPIVEWHHSDPGLSCPPGFIGAAAAGTVFYSGTSYPAEYRGALFFADYGTPSWIRVLRVDEQDRMLEVLPFAGDLPRVVDLQVDPFTGDVHYVLFITGEVRRIVYQPPPLPADVNGDGAVDTQDLVAVIVAWGPCPEPPIQCPADIDGSGAVEIADLVAVLVSWS
jgi:glucose/arabinose dehydrogenase